MLEVEETSYTPPDSNQIMIKGIERPNKDSFNLEAQESGKATNDLVYINLTGRFFMPYKNTIHQFELVKCHHGDRSLPKASRVTFEQVCAILGSSKFGPDAYEPLQKNRHARVLRERLDLFLAIQGQPPMPQPRYHTEFSFFCIVYFCLVLDPRNLTGWSDRPVDLEGLDQSNFVYCAWQLKTMAYNELAKLGFRMFGQMEKAAKAILHFNHDIMRFREYDRNSEKKSYGDAIKNTESSIAARFRGLAKACWGQYILDSNSTISQVQWLTQFDKYAKIALSLDPLDTSLSHGEIRHLISEEKVVAMHDQMRDLKARLANKYGFSDLAGAPVQRKNGPVPDVNVTPYTPWWTAMTREQLELIPASKENVCLSIGDSDMMVSLGKRIRKMKVDASDTEDFSSKKKSVGFKSTSGMDAESIGSMKKLSDEQKADKLEKENGLHKYFSSSMKKGSSTQKKNIVMDEETLSFNDVSQSEDELSQFRKANC